MQRGNNWQYMKIIDSTILEALREMRKNYSTTKELAAVLGVSAQLAAKLLSGGTSHFRNDTWMRIHPLLVPYMEKVLNRKCAGCEKLSGCKFKHLIQNMLEIPESKQTKLFDKLNEIVLRELNK